MYSKQVRSCTNKRSSVLTKGQMYLWKMHLDTRDFSFQLIPRLDSGFSFRHLFFFPNSRDRNSPGNSVEMGFENMDGSHHCVSQLLLFDEKIKIDNGCNTHTIKHLSDSCSMYSSEVCLRLMTGIRPQCCTVRSYWDGDNLGKWDEFMVWIMPQVEDRSLDLLTCNPRCYHCATAALIRKILVTIV